jgi:hypothetical protein
MPLTITDGPHQLAESTKLGDRVFVNTTFDVANGPLDATIEVSVRPKDAARGYSVTQGGSRTESLPNGVSTRQHWFVLAGPHTQNVVACRAVATAPGDASTRAGFEVTIDRD